MRASSNGLEGIRALKISRELNVDLLLVATVLLMLLLALTAILGVGATAKRWMLDAQAGLAAAEVVIAYSSFAVNVYRAAMR